MVNNSKANTLSLYKNSGWKSIFSHIRFWDAPLVEVEKLIPKTGVITELGCGDGVFSNYMALSSTSRQVIGIEIDKKRIKEADKRLSNTKYISGDIRKVIVPKSDAIVIFHVLHHLASHKEQEDLINTLKSKLKKNGMLIVVEIHVTLSPKYLLGWFFDHFLVPIFFESRIYSKIFYRTRHDWEKLLHNKGFDTRTISLSSGKPISNIAIICRNEEKN